jgi:2-methylcitrate dehydratase PrpD
MNLRHCASPAMQIHTDFWSDLAAFAAQTRYEDPPANAVEGAKKSIVDTLGVMFAAGGSRAECSMLGFGHRLKTPQVLVAAQKVARHPDAVDDATELLHALG